MNQPRRQGVLGIIQIPCALPAFCYLTKLHTAPTTRHSPEICSRVTTISLNKDG